MSKTNNIISARTKAQILAELEVPGCVVSKLAKSYNVSTTSIYTWQRQKEAKETGSTSNFVELSVEAPLVHTSWLQKASLVFDQFSLVIEGKLSSKTLLSLIKILEEEAC